MRGCIASHARGRCCKIAALLVLAHQIVARVGLGKIRSALGAEIAAADLRPFLCRSRKRAGGWLRSYDGSGGRAA